MPSSACSCPAAAGQAVNGWRGEAPSTALTVPLFMVHRDAEMVEVVFQGGAYFASRRGAPRADFYPASEGLHVGCALLSLWDGENLLPAIDSDPLSCQYVNSNRVCV
jgi:hypothetical protein